MNTEYMLPVCRAHLINLSFTKGYLFPSGRKGTIDAGEGYGRRCMKRNCYRDATQWLVIDLREAIFGDPSRPEPKIQVQLDEKGD